VTADKHRPMTMRSYSTVQVAQKLGFGQAYLQRLIARRAVPFPPLVKVGGLKIRLWGDRDVARLRKALAKRPRNRSKA
jgi:predicted DNA-binding transcriptional regulator AlpA